MSSENSYYILTCHVKLYTYIYIYIYIKKTETEKLKQGNTEREHKQIEKKCDLAFS